MMTDKEIGESLKEVIKNDIAMCMNEYQKTTGKKLSIHDLKMMGFGIGCVRFMDKKRELAKEPEGVRISPK